jgi:hypothetical protein
MSIASNHQGSNLAHLIKDSAFSIQPLQEKLLQKKSKALKIYLQFL